MIFIIQQRQLFIVEDLHIVFALDALGTSHPVRVPVNSPEEINEIFDTISYSKVSRPHAVYKPMQVPECLSIFHEKYLF